MTDDERCKLIKATQERIERNEKARQRIELVAWLANTILAILAVAAVVLLLTLQGCGGGDPIELPQSTYMPVSCNQPGACT